MKKPIASGGEILLVAQIAAAISIASFFYYLRHSDLLLYGDAVAHINIARRVFDSRTPGPLQLGTVWLPLPHLLMLPFLLSRWLWQTGIGGSIPSLFAYVLSVTGIFRLVRDAIPAGRMDGEGLRSSPESRFTAWFAAGIFALNPNLIYLQTTAMTEPVYLSLFIWAVIFFGDFVRAISLKQNADLPLLKCGLSVAAACLTRYDGWLLALVLCVAAWMVSRRAMVGGDPAAGLSSMRPKLRKLFLLAVACPVFWLVYNAAVYGNPLEFANGPYSARAIEHRSAVVPHPGTGDLSVAFTYYFKSAQLNMGEEGWRVFWVSTLLGGTAIALLFQRKLWPLLLLWTPGPFYMCSVAYSGVPIFVPVWWPFSLYNVRYGVEMLPAFAVFTAVAAYGLIRFGATRKIRLVIAILFVSLTAGSYVQALRAGPVSFKEAVINSRARIALEERLALELQKLPLHSRFLMYMGDHVGAFQRAGIPLWQVINEGNHRPGRRSSDPDGLWEKALQHPAAYADFVIAFDGDIVGANVEKREMRALEIIRVSGQAEATIYGTVKNQPR